MANFRLTQLANFVDIFKNADVVTGIFDSADDRRLCNGVSGEHAFRRSGLAVMEYSQSPDPREFNHFFATAIRNDNVKPWHQPHVRASTASL